MSSAMWIARSAGQDIDRCRRKLDEMIRRNDIHVDILTRIMNSIEGKSGENVNSVYNQCIIDISEWDFEWEEYSSYRLKEIHKEELIKKLQRLAK